MLFLPILPGRTSIPEIMKNEQSEQPKDKESQHKPIPGSPEARRQEEEKAKADKKAKALGEDPKDGFESSGDPESAQNSLI